MAEFTAFDPNLAAFSGSPYFTLTTSWFLSDDRKNLGKPPVPLPPKPRQAKLKPEKFTVEVLYGRMRKMSDDTQTQFLLLLMKHVDVDWSAACKEAAKARSIRPACQVQERLSRIANKHAFKLEENKKITGGSLLNKTLLAKPMADPAGSKEPKVPKIPRKRKSGDADQKALGTKKKRTTTETQTTGDQHTEQLDEIPTSIHVPAQEADNKLGAGSDGNLA